MPRNSASAAPGRSQSPRRRIARRGAVPPAKLAQPRLAHPIARKSLFKELSKRLSHSVAWILGPPGSGKTTLAASFASASGHAVLWYQVDRGDSDIASFFHYLEQAVLRHGRRRSIPTPRYGQELRSDIAGFTRRFARVVFAYAPAPSMLVLDNVHEASGPAFAEMLSTLLEELPPGISAIVTSRSAPAPEFSGLLAKQRITVLDPERLPFSRREAAQLLSSRGVAASEIDRIRELTQGWAAGLILLSGAAEDAGGKGLRSAGSREALFAYFATQVVATLPESWQRFLLVTSVLPKVAAGMGEELSGVRDERSILESLYRQNLFVERRGDREATYQYHALFREFLCARARDRFTADELAATRRRAAELAESRGWIEEAIALRIEAREWSGAARLIAHVSQALLEQGRAQTVEDWIGRIPAAELPSFPRLAYRLGHARMHRDELAAREAFAGAYRGFVEAGDELGALLAASATLETLYVSYRDWEGTAFWIAIVLDLRRRLDSCPDLLCEFRVDAGYLIALLMNADRDDEAALATEERLLRRLQEPEIDVNERLRILAMMVDMCHRLPDWVARFDRILRVGQPLLQRPSASPLLKLRYLMYSAPQLVAAGRQATAERAIRDAREIQERHGWKPMRFELAYHELRCAFATRDATRCEALLAEARAELRPANSPQRVFIAIMEYYVALLRDDKSAALASAREMVRTGREAGLPSADSCTLLLALANAYGVNRRYGEAAQVYAEAAAMLRGHARSEMLCLRELVLAYTRIEEVPNPALESGLRIARQIGLKRFHLSDVTGALCEAALRQGIEPDHVRSIIRTMGLAPRDPHQEEWPWAIQVRTLGDFVVLKDGVAFAAAGKPARRPLGLLKLIVASGNREIPASRAIASLWPELEGDQAKSAFNVTLHRLRKLLGSDAAVLLEGGMLGLSASHVWVDAFAFEHHFAAAEADMAAGAADAAMRHARAALQLYRGPFLRTDEDEPWALVQRTRLAGQYTRLATLASRHCMRTGDPERARAILERAIDLDSLAEELYRQLMQLLMGMGLPAEALKVYRRCREMLSVVLGMKPSPETERIREVLRQGAAG